MALNKIFFRIIFLVILISLSFEEDKRKSFKELINHYLGKLDINNAYLSYDQYISLLKTLKNDYPNYLELSSIGKTYQGNDIPLIIFKSPLYEESNETKKNDINNQTILNQLNNDSGVLFDGMHHGREPVSMMMNIYLILHLLSLPKHYLHLFLSLTNIYFIPIINIDTYKYNCEKYFSSFSTHNMMARKNRREIKSIKCKDEDIGVDLNRNYDYDFGKDNEGSSNNVCQEDYRGEYAFSEPETNNIKKFIESHPNIKIVYNYHSWGNLIITAFNSLSHNESTNLLKNKFPLHYEMYQDFKKEGEFPQNFLFGNADNTIKYKANGDATDWFLGKKNILSFSPELGNGKKNSDVFYPNKDITFDILEKNLYGGLYAIQKSMYFLKSELISAEYYLCSNTFKNNYNDMIINYESAYNKKNPNYKIYKCSNDDIAVEIKAKIINKGFASYKPGIVFPFSSNMIKNNLNKKYYYFFGLDISVDISKIQNICYWSTLQTLYMKEINSNNNKDDDVQYIGNINCKRVNDSLINDFKIFLGDEIKPMEYIILNMILIFKKDAFFNKININNNSNNARFLDMRKNMEEVELIKIYTKNEFMLKSERENGEKIIWRFNGPDIDIKIRNFTNKNNNKFFYNNNKQNSYKALFIIIAILIFLIIFIYRTVKHMHIMHRNSMLINGSIDNNINTGMNNERIVNNLESVNQNSSRNNDNIQAIQIPREENDIPGNSNQESPNELNT